MAERFNATVLKTVVAKVTLSSNLSPSAKKYDTHLTRWVFYFFGIYRDIVFVQQVHIDALFRAWVIAFGLFVHHLVALLQNKFYRERFSHFFWEMALTKSKYHSYKLSLETPQNHIFQHALGFLPIVLHAPVRLQYHEAQVLLLILLKLQMEPPPAPWRRSLTLHPLLPWGILDCHIWGVP